MKNTNFLLKILTWILLFTSCSYPIPRTLMNSFTYCYNGNYTGLDTLINIDGYYQEMFIHENSRITGKIFRKTLIHYIDTFYHHFMFYDNGTFVYNIRDSYYDDEKKEYIKKDVLSVLKDFSGDSEVQGAKWFYGNFWGSYIICGDTLKVQQAYKMMSWNDSWHLREKWYKIIDKNTLLWINAFNLPLTLYSPCGKNKVSDKFCPYS